MEKNAASTRGSARLRATKALQIGEIPCIFPWIREFFRGEQFGSDCAIRHRVLTLYLHCGRSQIGIAPIAGALTTPSGAGHSGQGIDQPQPSRRPELTI